MHLPSHDDVCRAAERLAGQIVRTPTLRSPALDRLVGGTVLLKPEPLQRTGSFKLRGATNALLSLGEADRERGVVTFSSGNHGQAVACAAASLGVSASVFMPTDAPRIKVESTRAWGAAVIGYERGADRQALARDHARRTGAVLVPPFDDADVIAGQGTLALELAQDAETAGLSLQSLLVCTGGGGLVAGCALALEGMSPATEVCAVEPDGWDDTARSLTSGTPEVAKGGSLLCDSLLTPRPGELTFAINRRLLARGLVVSDAEVLAAMAFCLRHLKLVVEPGGAVALAALLAGRIESRGRVTGVVLSGGNVEADVLRQALDQA